LAIFRDYYPKANPSISMIRLPSYSLFFAGLIDWILSEDLASDELRDNLRGKIRGLWEKMIEARTIILVWELHHVSLDLINQVNEKLQIADSEGDSGDGDGGGGGGDENDGSGRNSSGNWDSITSLA
jgi:hypothetical protein